MSRFIMAVLIAAVLVVVSACGDTNKLTQPPPDLSVAQVHVSPAGGQVEVQQTLQLYAIAKNAAGDELQGKVIAWSSSDEGLAIVSGTGNVTGVAEGTVMITAASEGRSAGVEIQVKARPVPPPPPPQGNPVAEIESLSPAVVLVGAGEATITVHGRNFLAGSVGMWNGGSRGTELIGATELRITLQGEDLSAIGTGAIRVFNPAPGGGMSNALEVAIASRARLQLTPDVATLAVGDTLRVRATIHDQWGVPVPSTGSIRVQWLRRDAGTQLEAYDAVRDSIRVRVVEAGTWRVVGRTLDGLFADTLVVTGVRD